LKNKLSGINGLESQLYREIFKFSQIFILRILKTSGLFHHIIRTKLAIVAVVGGAAAVENCLLDRQKQPGKMGTTSVEMENS